MTVTSNTDCCCGHKQADVTCFRLMCVLCSLLSSVDNGGSTGFLLEHLSYAIPFTRGGQPWTLAIYWASATLHFFTKGAAFGDEGLGGAAPLGEGAALDDEGGATLEACPGAAFAPLAPFAGAFGFGLGRGSTISSLTSTRWMVVNVAAMHTLQNICGECCCKLP